MARLRIGRPVRAALLDQLVAAGIAPLTPEGTTVLDIDQDNNDGWLTVPDAQVAAARAAIAAHDAAAIDATQAAQVAQDENDFAGFRAVYQALMDDATRLEDPAVTLNTQQLRNRLAALERVVARMARYVGHRVS